MSDGRDKDFTEAYELNTFREHISAYVLVGGLVLELVNAGIWYEGTKTLAEMAAVTLIVLGVWGEVFFGNRARIAADGQLEEYRARTAEANQRAQEATLELAKYRAPRRFTQEQLYRIAEKLKPFAASGMQYACASVGMDPEHIGFLQAIEAMLLVADWREIDWQWSSGVARGAGRTTIGTDISVSNVFITFPLENRAVTAAAVALMNALKEEGFVANTGPEVSNPGVVKIMIGPKT
jgi:hypothetical protein